MHGHLPHPATPISDADLLFHSRKKRGNYTCSRCSFPKKGHKCQFTENSVYLSTPVSTPAAAETSALTALNSTSKVTVTAPPSVVRSVVPAKWPRALSFDDVSAAVEEDLTKKWTDPEVEVDVEPGNLTANSLWEVLRRLPPAELLAAAMVCKGWRETTVKLWRAAEELRLRVPMKTQIGFVEFVLQKCPGLLRLSLRLESDFDTMMLACIAFSCCNLQSLEITMSDSCVNLITGNNLSHFITEKRCLTSLKMEGCFNLDAFVLSSASLSTIWLSDLHSLSKMEFNCPNLKEISLDFSRKENESTDLITSMDALGRSCPKLQNIHIASTRLSHATVLALAAANLRGLRMLSLVLGSEITDASVAAIASSFPKLELLDLSGSSISDSGIGMICNVFSETLSKLLLALCPNISSSGIQFAAAQLPCLELMDCGMTICDPNSENSIREEKNNFELDKTPNSKSCFLYQKLIIKHSRLRKLSLWGCSGLDALYLNCPQLIDLNLNSCKNLHAERLLLQCPNLEIVHASDCKGLLVEAIETQVSCDFSDVENILPSKRLPNSSKRVRVPYHYSPKPCDEKNLRRVVKCQRAVIMT